MIFFYCFTTKMKIQVFLAKVFTINNKSVDIYTSYIRKKLVVIEESLQLAKLGPKLMDVTALSYDPKTTVEKKKIYRLYIFMQKKFDI